MNYIRTGFRTVRHNPALVFAEIAWRWVFGVTAWLLVIVTVRTIMAGVDVSAAEIALARSNDAYLIADAIVRVLIQVLPRFLAALFLIIPLLAVVWTLAATIGRAVTADALLRGDESEQRLAAATDSGRVILSEVERRVSVARPQRRIYAFGLLFLNCLRAVFSLATLLAFFGTVVLVSASINPGTTPEVAPAYVLAWLFLAFLVGCFWGLVNWFLALAPIFIVRDGFGVWKALSASVGLYRDHRRDYMSIASWFGFFRGAALVVAVFAGFLSIAAGWRAGLIASAVIALIYFAVADTLYIARFAAYAELAMPIPNTTVPLGSSSAEPAAPSDVQHLELET